MAANIIPDNLFLDGILQTKRDVSDFYSNRLPSASIFVGYGLVTELTSRSFPHYWCSVKDPANEVVVFRDELVCRSDRLTPLYSLQPSNFELFEALTFLSKFWTKSRTVQPCVILEPLKGRMITKPSSGDYLGMNRIQKFLWKRLQHHREFELTGRPVDDDDIWYVAKSWKFGFGFDSGDFSQATDNLSSELSELILDFLFEKFDSSSEFMKGVKETFLNSEIDYSFPPVSDQGFFSTF
jgi:hypothetical protein